MVYLSTRQHLDQAAPDTARLVQAIAQGDELAAHQVLRNTQPAQLLAIITALATTVDAATPANATCEEFLRWAITSRNNSGTSSEAARTAGSGARIEVPMALHHDEADWSGQELRAAHAAHARGVRNLWADEGERIYQRLRGRQRQAARHHDADRRRRGVLVAVAS